MTELHFGPTEPHETPRSLGLSIRRGLMQKCPHCGKGKIFGSYLKVLPTCSVCGEELSHHRADDLPAYIVLFIVGHIVIATLMSVDQDNLWPLWIHMILWPLMTVCLSLILLQPIKGAVIGLQWALKMHGFSSHPDGDESPLFRPTGGAE